MKGKVANRARKVDFEISVNLGSERVIRFLSDTLLILTLTNLVLVLARDVFDSRHWFLPGSIFEKIEFNLVRCFDFNGESNIPTLFSSLLLISCSFILYLIYRKVADSKLPRHKKSWLFLSMIFLYMAIDESIQIHEMSIGPVRSVLTEPWATYLNYAWVIPYGLITLISVLYLIPMFLNLDLKTQKLFTLSGIIYISGAIGLEILGGYVAAVNGVDNIFYKLAYTSEEFLEMIGVIMFIYSLLDYVERRNLSFVFKPKMYL